MTKTASKDTTAEHSAEPIGENAPIGKLAEAEYRFSSGARLQVADNALVGWGPEKDDDFPYRWRVVGATDELVAEGGCNGGYDALIIASSALVEAEASYAEFVNGARGKQ